MKTLDPLLQRLFRLLSVTPEAGEPGVSLDDSEWRDLLAFCDQTQMTLLLENAPGAGLPSGILREIEVRRSKNIERGERLWAAYEEIARGFETAGIDFVVLKGFTHFAYSEWRQRVQYDIDLLVEPAAAQRAVAVLTALGYRPHHEPRSSDKHLPTMLRPTSWEWKGDYFDPNIPVSIDIHTDVWSDAGDRIRLDGAQDFWGRRSQVWFRRMFVPALHRCDRLAFAAMHAVRHILRNDARPAHVFELARFLHDSVGNTAFWDEWVRLHDDALRSIQALAFRFAAEWFGCELPPQAAAAVAGLPRSVAAWFGEFSWSPVANLVQPNKDAVWLHMALLGSVRDRASVLRRRLLPFTLTPCTPGGITERARHHASAIAPVLASGFRWWRRSTAS
jgi:hypothetical protein